jgi:hypothetical protein
MGASGTNRANHEGWPMISGAHRLTHIRWQLSRSNPTIPGMTEILSAVFSITDYAHQPILRVIEEQPEIQQQIDETLARVHPSMDHQHSTFLKSLLHIRSSRV